MRRREHAGRRRWASLLILAVCLPAAGAARAERIAACSSSEALDRASPAAGTSLPEDCRWVTLERLAPSGDICRFGFQVEAGGLVDAVADVPDEWFLACDDLEGAISPVRESQ